MSCRKKHATWRNAFVSILLLLSLVLAGPEIGLSLEIIATIDALGLGLFIVGMSAPFWVFWYRFKAFWSRIDPYFFVPSISHIVRCPALLAHAIPLFMLFMLEWALILNI